MARRVFKHISLAHLTSLAPEHASGHDPDKVMVEVTNTKARQWPRYVRLNGRGHIAYYKKHSSWFKRIDDVPPENIAGDPVKDGTFVGQYGDDREPHDGCYYKVASWKGGWFLSVTSTDDGTLEDLEADLGPFASEDEALSWAKKVAAEWCYDNILGWGE